MKLFRSPRWLTALALCLLTPVLVFGDVVPEPPVRLLRALLDAGTAHRVVVNNSSGVMSDAAAITAARALISDADGIPTHSATVDSTELSYLDGATSSVQTQLGTKLASSGGTGLSYSYSGASTVQTHADDGAGSGRLDLKRDSTTPATNDALYDIRVFGRDSANNFETFFQIAVGADDVTNTSEDATVRWLNLAAGSFVEAFRTFGQTFRLPGVTASRALATDGSSNVVASTTTATQLGYLATATSDIQAQIDAISAASGMKLLATYSPSAAASIDINSILGATYDVYKIQFHLFPSAEPIALWMRTDSANGASFDTGASDYGYENDALRSEVINSSFSTASGGDTHMDLCTTGTQSSADSSMGISGTITIGHLGTGTSRPMIYWDIAHLRSDDNTLVVRCIGGGTRLSTTAINAAQILFTGGNATGKVRIYGLVN